MHGSAENNTFCSGFPFGSTDCTVESLSARKCREQYILFRFSFWKYRLHSRKSECTEVQRTIHFVQVFLLEVQTAQ